MDMSIKNVEYYIYLCVIGVWVFCSYITYTNIKNNYDLNETILICLLFPIMSFVLICSVMFCIYSYIDIGISCFEKIGTEEPWDFVEAFWFFNIFLDDW